MDHSSVISVCALDAKKLMTDACHLKLKVLNLQVLKDTLDLGQLLLVREDHSKLDGLGALLHTKQIHMTSGITQSGPWVKTMLG